MKPHFNEDALIKYQFGLCDEQRASQIAEHLKGCEVCTAQLEKVRQNFAALDILKEDESISAELIEETVAYAKQPRQIRTINRPIWLSAAAVLAVCALIALMAPYIAKQKGIDNVAIMEQKKHEPINSYDLQGGSREDGNVDEFDSIDPVRLNKKLALDERADSLENEEKAERAVRPEIAAETRTLKSPKPDGVAKNQSIPEGVAEADGLVGNRLKGLDYAANTAGADKPVSSTSIMPKEIAKSVFEPEPVVGAESEWLAKGRLENLDSVFSIDGDSSLAEEISNGDQLRKTDTSFALKDTEAMERPKARARPAVTAPVAINKALDTSGSRGAGVSDGAKTVTKLSVPSDKYFYSVADAVVVDAESIPGRAPFAPASAIELVVLPKRENIQLTIYNSADLTLVREKRNLTLKAGWNWLQFMWANTLIDPTSLRLEPLEYKDKIDVQELVYPARLKDIGRWLMRSEVEGQVPFEITYFISGLKWRAFYTGTLADDEKTMALDGYVRVGNNSGETYEDAQTRLIVGKVNLLDKIATLAKRQYPYGGLKLSLGVGSHGGPIDMIKDGILTNGSVPLLGDELKLGSLFSDGHADFLYSRPKEIKKQGLSEYFLYSIEGRETIANKWAKRLPSFQARDIPVKSLYKYDDERYGSQTMRFVFFANDDEHELGQTPIPDGAVKVYKNVSEKGNLSYVGGTNIKYIPVNEKIELPLGANRLVKVAPVLMDQATENYIFDSRKRISGYDEVQLWKLEVTNSRKLEAKIEITRHFGMTAWDLVVEDKIASSKNFVEYKKHDAQRARFTLTVPAETKRVFHYRLRKYNGRRSEHWSQRNKGIMEGETVLLPTDDGNFTLYVSNQSLALSPVDISVYVDDMKLLDKEFNVSGKNSKMIQHNWKTFKYKLAAGKHKLRVFSTRGDAEIETEFETGDKNWAVLDYWYYPEGSSSDPMEKQLMFKVHDKQVYFE